MPSSASGTSSAAHSTYRPVSYTHLAWSIGHLVVLLSTIWNTLGILFLHSRPRAYSLAYGGAILSWSIVVYKSLGPPSLSRNYVQRAAMDENVQYLVVALYWFFSKPIFGLSFIRTAFLPKVPSKKDASGVEQPPQVGVVISRVIQNWVKENYESAMYCVAFIEVVMIQGRVTLGALTFQNSFLHPLFFAHFLRLRYYLSPQTRSAVSTVNEYIDHYLEHPSCPAVVKKGINVVRSLITQYADSIISTAAAHPAARTVPQTPNSVNSNNNRTPNSR